MNESTPISELIGQLTRSIELYCQQNGDPDCQVSVERSKGTLKITAAIKLPEKPREPK